MNLLKDNPKKMYFRFLAAAFGATLVSCIYSIVDSAMVGQYQGPLGTAALAIVSPIFNVIFSLGILTGTGGSVIFSTVRGASEKNTRLSNEYFTVAVIISAFLSLAVFSTVTFLETPLLRMFGGEDELIPLCHEYMLAIKFAIPLYIFSSMLSAFLRNDGSPNLAMAATLLSGLFNVVTDYLFVFPFGMGVFGAGLATALGAVVSFGITIIHFFKKTNTLRLVKPTDIVMKVSKILSTGFSTFFVDIAMGILTVLFNRQILKYLGSDALAVYGIIISINTFVHCASYSIGQASQPIFSANYGAGQYDRIKKTLRYAIGTTIVFGILWSVIAMSIPNVFVKIFMKPTDAILAIAPGIMRRYCCSFLLITFNVFSTFYFQSLSKNAISFTISVTRGALVSGALIMILPALFGGEAIWWAIPLSELIVLTYSITKMKKCTSELK